LKANYDKRNLGKKAHQNWKTKVYNAYRGKREKKKNNL